MMVAHVGPPPRRIGGPAGYLHQLLSGASTDPQTRHVVRFPPASTTAPKRPPPPPLNLLTKLRRKVIGPKFYRPSVAELAAPGGRVDRMLRDMATDTCAESQASLASSAAADVIFTHDPFSAEAALRQRAASQQVWMMCHGVTPIVVYAVWSWGIPEADWRSFLEYPDVRTWIDWELDVWSRVDRLVFPCPEATDSFRIVDSRFDTLAARAQFVLNRPLSRQRGTVPRLRCAPRGSRSAFAERESHDGDRRSSPVKGAGTSALAGPWTRRRCGGALRVGRLPD